MRRKRAAKGSVDRNYFTMETQDAIIRYVESDDQVLRNKLYRDYIDKAFNKLAEILIHKGKFYYAGPDVDEIKSLVIMHLLEKLNNYKVGKGKAYSYFTVVVWRYLINLNNNNYQRIKNNVHEVEYHDMQDREEFAYDNQEVIDKSQFFDELLLYLDDNLSSIYPRKKDMAIANALTEIFKRRNNLENFNKKALYIYIREMTGCKSSQITSIVNSFELVYLKAWDDFIVNGYLTKNKSYR